MKKLLLALYLFMVPILALPDHWVKIWFKDGSMIEESTTHTSYVVFDINEHNGESRGNVPHALCIHDWNGSIAGFRVTKDVYQKLVDQINVKSPQSIIEWVCHEGKVNGWNDLWLDPKYIAKLENYKGDVIEVRIEGRQIILMRSRR